MINAVNLRTTHFKEFSPYVRLSHIGILHKILHIGLPCKILLNKDLCVKAKKEKKEGREQGKKEGGTEGRKGGREGGK